ncbi:MAG: membrane protein insertion efficiency factor YidD [Candidatus Riflebacteria bacterium]|nr:membrane protein insertion efficiency factor YidD [Candidatus Riflebacteria bacterium]
MLVLFPPVNPDGLQISGDSEAPGSVGIVASASLVIIRWYQRWLSPWIGVHCRFHPTCSRYTYQAIVKYGFWRGWLMGIYRILRCNPFSRGGEDPVV